MKVLILDDGKPHRVEKTDLYAMIAELGGAEVAVTRGHNVHAMTADQLKGYDAILTDFDGMKQNEPHHKAFFALLNAAVAVGEKPKVAMFSGAPDYKVDLSATPALADIVTTHNAVDSMAVIQKTLGSISQRGTNGGGQKKPTGTILVVDEYKPTLDAIKSVLEDEGHKVLTAQSPLEALDLWRENRKGVDMVLTQRAMNGDEMAGIKLTQRLRALGTDIPVVMQTDLAVSKNESDMFLHAGGTKFLPNVTLPLISSAVNEQLAASARGRH